VRYLLDSNIIIRALRAEDDRLRLRLGACDEGDIVTSVIAYAEVLFGSRAGKPPEPEQLEGFLEEIPILDFDRAAALAHAGLPFRRASYDRLIAAHALSLGLVVVTDNLAHFADVPGLSVENWTLPL
jgi:tRNA(fMet)-specific endonuclease VapC